jgi:hypothetical protein
MVKVTRKFIDSEDNFEQLYSDETTEFAGHNLLNISRINLSIRCYCEGDESIIKCDTVEEFNEQIRKQNIFYNEYFGEEHNFLNDYIIHVFKVKTDYTEVESLGTELYFNKIYSDAFNMGRLTTFKFYPYGDCLCTDNFIEIQDNIKISHLRLLENHVVVAVGHKNGDGEELLFNVTSGRFHPLTSHRLEDIKS